MVVDDLRGHGLHQGQEDALGGQAQVKVLHGRAAHDGAGVDEVLAVGDVGHVKDRIFVGQGVEARVVAEGPLGAPGLGRVHVALDDHLGLGGDQ